MTHAPAVPYTDHMQILFGLGTCTGMTDGQLLERFMAGRDEAGELAFEALMVRHGPMVMRVCRNVLDDPHDVHDAYQAVFLVLAKRANAIRDHRSVGSWLYGVAVRVTARAKVAAIRRQIRDRRKIAAAQTIAAVTPILHGALSMERNDCAEVVHQELNRLPDKYRAPVVLCYLEGLTHDEAAARLNWPVGTVRSRLARARDRLRIRLNRRGVTAPLALGPLTSWLLGEPSVSAASVASFSSVTIARELSVSIVRTASQLAAGRVTSLSGVQTASLSLARGVIETMMFKKLLIVLCVFLPVAFTALGGAVFVTQKTEAQIQNSPAAAAVQRAPNATNSETAQADDFERLARQLLDAARKRYDAQKAYYEEGRITTDRFVDASKLLELAELRLSKNDADRLVVRQRHVDRIKEIEHREKAELAIGRGTVADVAEIYARRLEAELDLKLSRGEASEMATLLRRLNDLERKVDQLQKERVVK